MHMLLVLSSPKGISTYMLDGQLSSVTEGKLGGGLLKDNWKFLNDPLK